MGITKMLMLSCLVSVSCSTLTKLENASDNFFCGTIQPDCGQGDGPALNIEFRPATIESCRQIHEFPRFTIRIEGELIERKTYTNVGPGVYTEGANISFQSEESRWEEVESGEFFFDKASGDLLVTGHVKVKIRHQGTQKGAFKLRWSSAPPVECG